MKNKKRKIGGGFIATVGYLLSPLSWWNDILVNIPLAYAFAFPFGLISKKLFLPMMILGYWLTNILGFMMMHHGAKNIVSKDVSKFSKKDFKQYLLLSIAYTVLVVVFIKMGWLKFPMEFFE